MQQIYILHGALGSAHQFEPLSHILKTQHNTECTIVEFIGHGSKPDVNEPWTIEMFCDELLPLFKKAINPVQIFGYSMGGYVAIELAKQYPQLVESICTLGTKLWWTPALADAEKQRLVPEIIVQKVPAFAADLQRRHGSEHWETVLHKTAQLMQSLGSRPLLTPDTVGSVHTAIRLGVGDRDELVRIEETTELYRALPNASLAVLPNTKHPIEKVDISMLAQYVWQSLS